MGSPTPITANFIYQVATINNIFARVDDSLDLKVRGSVSSPWILPGFVLMDSPWIGPCHVYNNQNELQLGYRIEPKNEDLKFNSAQKVVVDCYDTAMHDFLREVSTTMKTSRDLQHIQLLCNAVVPLDINDDPLTPHIQGQGYTPCRFYIDEKRLVTHLYTCDGGHVGWIETKQGPKMRWERLYGFSECRDGVAHAFRDVHARSERKGELVTALPYHAKSMTIAEITHYLMTSLNHFLDKS